MDQARRETERGFVRADEPHGFDTIHDRHL
jgi:hypothetical protein